MRVLVAPFVATTDNPYLPSLVDWLRRTGLEVATADLVGSRPLRRALVGQRRPDVLHLHWTHGPLTGRSAVRSLVKGLIFASELAALKARGIRLVWTVHNVVSHEAPYPRLETTFHHLLSRSLYDRLIVHSRAAAAAVISAFALPAAVAERIAVVPHAHYLDHYPNEVGRGEARLELGLGADDLVFLSFGQVRPYKGVIELLTAFAGFQHPRARLLVVGRPSDPELATRVAAACAADRRVVAVLDHVGDGAVQLYMNAADAVVLPFLAILTSSSVVLAMSFARAVVAPAIGGLVDLLDQRGAVLYDPREPDAVVTALHRAAASDLAAMGAHNHREIAAFTWPDAARQTAAVYAAACGRQSWLGEEIRR